MGYISTPVKFSGTPTDVSSDRAESQGSTHNVYRPSATKAVIVYVSLSKGFTADSRTRAAIRTTNAACFEDNDGALTAGSLLVAEGNHESGDGYSEKSLTFIVPAGYYYEVHSKFANTIDGWVEMELI